MRTTLCLLALLLTTSSYARTLEVGQGAEFTTLQAAAVQTQPGDTILIRGGIYPTAGQILNLQGTEQAPIVIRSARNEEVIFRGGSNGIQFTDAAWLEINGLIFEQQTGNGVNMDDGGSTETPSHHISIRNCEWRALNASGNNDQLKLSGIDYFYVLNCTFTDGAEGGSAVDMVGCHFGIFENNTFQNAGSNSIQAKGGSSDILIRRNFFRDGGQRSINIGGSTGSEFFRPLGATYEAASIHVRANIFEGSVAPIAFVGAINSTVTNNTIIRPERWAVRILQENVEGMQPCGTNSFYNNIIVFNSQQPAFNIGGNTSPETFVISHNLWYNPDNSNWSGPNTPVNEFGRILNEDPQFVDSYRITATSPAYRKGRDLDFLEADFYGTNFHNPPSMGAVEAEETGNVDFDDTISPMIAFPNPTTGKVVINSQEQHASVIDIMGRVVLQTLLDDQSSIDLSALPSGHYLVVSGSHRTRIVKH